MADERIGLFDNGGPNDLHAEPTIAAAEAGKHVICEKPLGRDAAEATRRWQRVDAAGVKHMCAFNYRFVPAVRLARELIDAGEIGEIRHFRAAYLQDWARHRRRALALRQEAAGSGALGDLGAHVVDLARYLAGEIETVSRACAPSERPGREVDDAIDAAVVRVRGGAVGTIEATRFATGRNNGLRWEINGSKGSLAFDLERLNELQVHCEGRRAGLPQRARHRDRPSVHGVLVAARPHHRLGAHLRARAAPPARRDRLRRRRRPAWRDLRGRLPRRRVCDAIVRSAQSGARETSPLPLGQRAPELRP